MAKRRGKRSGPKRRSRVGALALNAKSPLVLIGSAALGYFFADDINKPIDNMTGTMDQTMVGAAQTGLGAALMLMKLGRKKTMVEVVAGGVVGGAGLKRLLKATGVVNGYQRVPVVAGSSNGRLRGYGAVPVVGYGYNPAPSLNGYTTADVAINGSSSRNVMGSTEGSGLIG